MNICMYACMYVLYSYIRVCMHLCVYACMYICMHVCSMEVITNMLILFFVYRHENVKTHGAWDYSLEGRGRLQVPKDRSWTLNSYSFNTPPEQADIRSPRTDPLSKFRYMRSMV